MHSPSHPLRSTTDLGLTPHEVVDFLAQSHRWAGKGPRTLARAVAAALDAALHPDVVIVALDDSATGETRTAIDGRVREEANLSAEQWRKWLAPCLAVEANARAAVLPHPAHAGKVKLRVARVGIR